MLVLLFTTSVTFVSPGVEINSLIWLRFLKFKLFISIESIEKLARSVIFEIDLTLVLKLVPSWVVFLIKPRKTEFPSFKISLFFSKRSEKTKSSNTPPRSENLIIAYDTPFWFFFFLDF